MGEEEEVNTLANSLKKTGVAGSWLDALNKAKAILGFGNKAPDVKVADPNSEQKVKVDEIIKEVDQEIEEMKQIEIKEAEEPEPVAEAEKPLENQQDLSKFDDPSFNIAESDMKDMKVGDIVQAAESDDKSDDEIFTNDPETLDKEKEGEKIEHEENGMIMTNEELTQEDDLDDDAEKTNEEETYDVSKEG